MEALSQELEKEHFDQSSINPNSEMSSAWVLIDPDSNQKLSNIDFVLCINEFHKSLSDNLEVGVKIAHLGKQILFYIDHIAHQNKSMIYFKGHTVSGRLVHFVKHSSELKIELKALPRRNNDKPKTPFGFDTWDAYKKLKRIHA